MAASRSLSFARAERVQAEQDRERVKVDAETIIVKAKGEADFGHIDDCLEPNCLVRDGHLDTEFLRLIVGNRSPGHKPVAGIASCSQHVRHQPTRRRLP